MYLAPMMLVVGVCGFTNLEKVTDSLSALACHRQYSPCTCLLSIYRLMQTWSVHTFKIATTIQIGQVAVGSMKTAIPTSCAKDSATSCHRFHHACLQHWGWTCSKYYNSWTSLSRLSLYIRTPFLIPNYTLLCNLPLQLSYSGPNSYVFFSVLEIFAKFGLEFYALFTLWLWLAKRLQWIWKSGEGKGHSPDCSLGPAITLMGGRA